MRLLGLKKLRFDNGEILSIDSLIMNERFIGSDLKEAITWMQQKLHTNRPLAEQIIFSAIEAKKIIKDDNGIFLLENDEEMEKRKISSVQNNQHKFNTAKKWSRIHFRNHNNGSKKAGKYSLQNVNKKAVSKFSNAAEDMLYSSIAALPSGSIISEETEEPKDIS